MASENHALEAGSKEKWHVNLQLVVDAVMISHCRRERLDYEHSHRSYRRVVCEV
jgi:hypothetical protein